MTLPSLSESRRMHTVPRLLPPLSTGPEDIQLLRRSIETPQHRCEITPALNSSQIRSARPPVRATTVARVPGCRVESRAFPNRPPQSHTGRASTLVSPAVSHRESLHPGLSCSQTPGEPPPWSLLTEACNYNSEASVPGSLSLNASID